MTETKLHDPKYRFGDTDAVYHRHGDYYLPEDEPVVLFRGKDVGTLVALESYRRFMEYVADHADNDHAREVASAHAESIGERIETIAASSARIPRGRASDVIRVLPA
jgi:hypothetical protein